MYNYELHAVTCFVFLLYLQTCHQGQLRPGLGHPNQSEALARLCSEEETRHTALLREIATHSNATREGELECVRGFVEELSETTRKLLTLFDALTSDSDIALGGELELTLHTIPDSGNLDISTLPRNQLQK